MYFPSNLALTSLASRLFSSVVIRQLDSDKPVVQPDAGLQGVLGSRLLTVESQISFFKELNQTHPGRPVDLTEQTDQFLQIFRSGNRDTGSPTEDAVKRSGHSVTKPGELDGLPDGFGGFKGNWVNPGPGLVQKFLPLGTEVGFRARFVSGVFLFGFFGNRTVNRGPFVGTGRFVGAVFFWFAGCFSNRASFCLYRGSRA